MEKTEGELQKFKSKHVTFTMERHPWCVIEYRVQATPELVKKAREDALRSVAKEVSIPGFRKGRAPNQLIVKQCSSTLNERWKKESAHLIFNECQNLLHMPCISDEESKMKCTIHKLSIEEGAEIVYMFETDPIVPDIDLTTFELEEVERETIGEEQFQKLLHDMQILFAKWKQRPDGEAQVGDVAHVDIDIIEHNPPKNVLSNVRITISKDKMATWMFDLILGMKIGDAREGVSKADEDASEEAKKTTPPTQVRLTLRKLEQAILPEIDDFFAQQLGVKSVQELKEKILQFLNKRADQQQQKAYRDQVDAHLLNTYSFDIPKSYFTHEVRLRTQQLLRNMYSKECKLPITKNTQGNQLQEIEQRGEKAIRLFFISQKLMEKHKILISPYEIQQTQKTSLELLFTDPSDLYSEKERSAENQALALSRLMLEKTENYIISKAKIVPAKSKHTDNNLSYQQKEESGRNTIHSDTEYD